MPIKPENRLLYPPRKEWLAIRAEILERAANCCEWDGCGVPNGYIGYRTKDGGFVAVKKSLQADVDVEDGGFKVFRVVLTIAHKDHDPKNNGTPGSRPNLAAWCQYHHLAYDRAHHLENSRVTRDKKKGRIALPLFPAPMEQA